METTTLNYAAKAQHFDHVLAAFEIAKKKMDKGEKFSLYRHFEKYKVPRRVITELEQEKIITRKGAKAAAKWQWSSPANPNPRMVEKVMNTVKIVRPEQKPKHEQPEIYLKVGTDLKRVTWLQLFLPKVAKAAEYLKEQNKSMKTEKQVIESFQNVLKILAE
jgi:hypothetical protein